MRQRKPGFFDYGGQLWVFCQGLLSLIFLNAMFIIGSLPVLTVGTSLLALTEVTLDRIRYGGEAFSVFREFWQAYKRHMRRGIPLSLVLIPVAAALVLDFLWIAGGQSLFPGLFGVMGAVTVILLMILSYYLPPAEHRQVLPVGRRDRRLLRKLRPLGSGAGGGGAGDRRSAFVPVHPQHLCVHDPRVFDHRLFPVRPYTALPHCRHAAPR